jgi:hypothetical protein
MFKLSIIGSLCLVSLAYAQDYENSRFLQDANLQFIPKKCRDNTTIAFSEALNCGACI